MEKGFGLIARLGQESCFCSVWCFEDNGELSMIDPSSFPVNFWLGGCEPGVS